VWDAATRRFYISIPKTATNTNGEIDEINPATMAITTVFPTSAACGARLERAARMESVARRRPPGAVPQDWL
jgi:hypothetical protein